MGGLNWEAGLAGFGKGMLTGYQNVMEMKMKEDFMNRMEEARLVRDKNMAQWKNETIDAPARQQQQEFELDKQQAGFSHSENLQKLGFAHSEKMTAAQIAASDRRSAAERLERKQERLDNKIVGVMDGTGLPVTKSDLAGMDENLRTKVVSPETYQLNLLQKKGDQEFQTAINNTNKLANLEYQKTLESTGNQAQALARKVVVQKSGAQSQAEFAKYESYTDPERNKGYYSAIQDGIKEGAKALEMYPEASQRRELALKAGLDKQSAADPMIVDSFILEQYGARSGQAFLQSYLNNTGKGRPQSTTTTATNQSQPQLGDATALARAYQARDSKAIEIYNSLSPSDQAKVNNVISSGKLQAPKTNLLSDIFNPPESSSAWRK